MRNSEGGVIRRLCHFALQSGNLLRQNIHGLIIFGELATNQHERLPADSRAIAFDTAKVERVIACIDDNNEGARTIAKKIGMKELCALPPRRTVYVKYRDERSLMRA